MERENFRLQQALRRTGAASRALVASIKDPHLGTVTAEGRTIRQLLYDLIDEYKVRTEQLLWCRWDLDKRRNERKRALAELEAARVEFATYLMDVGDAELDRQNPRAANARVREMVLALLEGERRLQRQAKGALGPQLG